MCRQRRVKDYKGARIFFFFSRNPIIGWKPARKSPSLQNANKYVYLAFLKPKLIKTFWNIYKELLLCVEREWALRCVCNDQLSIDQRREEGGGLTFVYN